MGPNKILFLCFYLINLVGRLLVWAWDGPMEIFFIFKISKITLILTAIPNYHFPKIPLHIHGAIF